MPLDNLACCRAASGLAGSIPFRPNMTDRAAALTVQRTASGSPEAVEALAAFERAYAHDPLVMDKWFQIQAAAPGPQALETVRALCAHPAFSMTNPNRQRALVGTFSAANQTGFHRPDGESYRFFTETVLETEKRNPQMAARLATALRSWRSLEPTRQARARARSAVAGGRAQSADLKDIVEARSPEFGLFWPAH